MQVLYFVYIQPGIITALPAEVDPLVLVPMLQNQAPIKRHRSIKTDQSMFWFTE